jgi:hypothetical protein
MTEQGIQFSVLYSVITALTTAIVFLFGRFSRSEARMNRALQAEAERCEAEKVRMFAFTTKLIEYITVISEMTCSETNCPMRKAIPPAPKPTATDMGLREPKGKQL